MLLCMTIAPKAEDLRVINYYESSPSTDIAISINSALISFPQFDRMPAKTYVLLLRAPL